MKEDGHVLVIGAASMDMKGTALHPTQIGTSTPGILRTSIGGTARNIAENLARLQVDTILLSAVGDDAAGEQILGHAAASGINVNEVMIVTGGRSGAYMALISEDGALQYAIDDMEVLEAITPDFLDANFSTFKDARMVIVDANLTTPSINHVVSICGQMDIPICADPTSSTLAPRLRSFLDEFYMVSPNLTEVQTLTEQEFDSKTVDGIKGAARELVAQGAGTAIITLSEFGVVYATSDSSGHLPAIPTQIVDQTGAGDAQTAAIIFGLLEGIPIDESVRLGITAATLTLRTRESVRSDLSVDLLYDELVI